MRGLAGRGAGGPLRGGGGGRGGEARVDSALLGCVLELASCRIHQKQAVIDELARGDIDILPKSMQSNGLQLPFLIKKAVKPARLL